MPISRFKATCLAALERVRSTGRPLLVTRRGKPVARILPPSPEAPPKDAFGAMAGTGRILGDLVAPVSDIEEWEASQ
jgi:prevent-host-death family protein